MKKEEKNKNLTISLIVGGVLIILAIIGYFLSIYIPKKEDGYLNLNLLPPDCNIEKTCGDLVGIDCKSEVDGPYYYVEKSTGKIISSCGGICDSPNGCSNCPPKEWDCERY